ncbi:MAG: M14 family metallopeptidase, partial [Thermoanaerobaculia bacterium]|nr:M14 family metallopeptidase [Thermoanaerobaculia bacterium]
MRTRLIFCLLFATLPAVADELDPATILPPAMSWSGESRNLIATKDDPWITPAETSAFRFSPSYDETVAWLKKLDAASPEMQMISLAKSPEGRDIWMVIASKERAFTPEALRRSAKPILFAHGGIHAGEIDGKDAGLMLLRDMTARGRRRDLLDRANFLFIPILNVDGHERRSRFTRMNQRGPEIMGWRTNARNLNLNRDYTKLDTEEMRAVVRVLDRWQPDLYIDLHVTDGADYQYDITFGWNDSTGFSPQIVRWLDSTLRPAFDKSLRAAGHIPGQLVFPVDNQNPANGIGLGNSGARLSTGYGDVRNVATVLVENHSLKPYDQRVLGTYVYLEQTLRLAGREVASLRRAIETDRARRPERLPLTWRLPTGAEPEIVEILGVASRKTLSAITGDVRV